MRCRDVPYFVSEDARSIFESCRCIDFPYIKYDKNELHKDYQKLKLYRNGIEYIRQCILGISIIRHYHRSIYHAHVDGFMTPYEAWHDDKKLHEAIENCLIYSENITSDKVLTEFNVSKICPRVSVFNPVLAKYITLKYLNEFNMVFDPFSGFSGRMLGVCATGKSYIGQDLNMNAVRESNQIIQELELDAQVEHMNSRFNVGTYPCMLTCPPYGKKEIYNHEVVFLSCDEWITQMLDLYRCKRYVFVVDKTYKYADHIVEEFRSVSHLTTTVEYLVILDIEDI